MAKSAYLWCPAYPLADRAQRERAEGAAYLLTEALGLELVVSPLLERQASTGVWLPTSERLADLERGLRHDLLLAARGGYGCLDLLPYLLKYSGRRPAVLGFSDLTVFHALWRKKSWGTGWYGFMPGITAGGRALASALACLGGDPLIVDGGTDARVVVLRQGQAAGRIFPACLRVLTGLVGTPAMPDLSQSILALEDIDERPYRLDRDLQQLHLAGCLAGIRGLVFGRFPCADLPKDYAGPSAQDIANRWAQLLEVPAIFGLPFGHDPDPVTLPSGPDATLQANGDLWRLRIAAAGIGTQTA